jgi:hypothetical protein
MICPQQQTLARGQDTQAAAKLDEFPVEVLEATWMSLRAAPESLPGGLSRFARGNAIDWRRPFWLWQTTLYSDST